MSSHPSLLAPPGDPHPRRHRGLHAAVLTAALTTAVATTGIAAATAASAASTASGGSSAAAHPPAADRSQEDGPDLGKNVVVFDPSMSTASIQAKVDAIAKQQVGNQFDTERYSLLFQPGTYGSKDHPLIINVGYYTEVAGLGQSPQDVTINGHVDVYNQCLPVAAGAPTNCIALVNFWRSVSNLHIQVMGETGCRASADFWAVSQAAPMRRVEVEGGTLSFQDYCTSGPQYASGGFVADSHVPGTLVNGTQQQFLTRNSSIGTWSNGVWNQVFAGVEGAPAQAFPNRAVTGADGKPATVGPYTTLDTTPASREKPYLYSDGDHDGDDYRVFVPDAQEHSRGTTWEHGQSAGHSIPLSDFYVAHPGDRVSDINAALAHGKDLLLTPGVYDVDASIKVTRPGTVVMGLGIATLTAQKGAVPMTVSDVQGVDISGLMFDAGPVSSPVLLQVGTKGSKTPIDESDPTSLQDVFFRIGGPHLGKATTSLEVNLDETLIDDVWAWRADHGTDPHDVGWTKNTADTGVVVNGDEVTATGLFVEHYQKYNTIWNGEGGKTIFYQNELPYDAPNQAAWSHDGVEGWAAYKVANTVRTHEAWGLGSYIFTNVDPSLHATRGFEVPTRRGVTMHDLLTVELSAGTIDHVINDTGAPVTKAAIGVPSFVVRYPAR